MEPNAADWMQAIGGVVGGLGAIAAAIVAVIAIRSQQRTTASVLDHERVLDRDRRVAEQRQQAYAEFLAWYPRATELQRGAALSGLASLEGRLSLVASDQVLASVRDATRPLVEGGEFTWDKDAYARIRAAMRRDLNIDASQDYSTGPLT